MGALSGTSKHQSLKEKEQAVNCRQLIGNCKQVDRVVGEKLGNPTDEDRDVIVAKPDIRHEKDKRAPASHAKMRKEAQELRSFFDVAGA